MKKVFVVFKDVNLLVEYSEKNQRELTNEILRYMLSLETNVSKPIGFIIDKTLDVWRVQDILEVEEMKFFNDFCETMKWV